MAPNAEKTAVSHLPTQLGYYAEKPGALREVLRVVLVIALVLGVLRVVSTPVQILQLRASWDSGAIPKTEYYRVNSILSVAVPFVLAWCLVVGALGHLRHRPRARNLLLVWAWASLAWVAYGVSANVYYFLTLMPPGTQPLDAAGTVVQYLEQWVSTLVLPLVVLALMTRRPANDALRCDAMR